MKSMNAALATGLVLTLLTFGCDSDSSTPAGPTPDDDEPITSVLSLSVVDHEFTTSSREIASGWTTFEFENQSHAPHFVILEKMPTFEGEQMTVDDSKAEVVPVFQNFMDNFRGQAPSFPDAGFELPAWYGDVVFVGGPGLTAPGETSRTTVNLEPGTYVIECYVKTADGVFHSTEGMIEGLTVTGEDNASEPPSDVSARVTISTANGITVDGSIDQAGEHTFEVFFANQMAYSHFLGHDAHLVRLDGADMNELATWMNWLIPGSLAGAGPSGATFLGGTQDMPAGSNTFVTATLESGDYAWIAEVPDPDAKNMVVEFSVP